MFKKILKYLGIFVAVVLEASVWLVVDAAQPYVW